MTNQNLKEHIEYDMFLSAQETVCIQIDIFYVTSGQLDDVDNQLQHKQASSLFVAELIIKELEFTDIMVEQQITKRLEFNPLVLN